MEYLNVSALSIVTGKDRRTVSTRLESAGLEPRRNGSSHEYKTPEAVRAILAPELATGEAGENSKMLLDKFKAEKLGMEVEQMRGDLIPRTEVEDWAKDIIFRARSRILAMPGRMAHEVEAKYRSEAVKAANKIARETLNELANLETKSE